MEQLLLFDYCDKHSKRESVCKIRGKGKKKRIIYFEWRYWKTNFACEACDLDASIKMIKKVISYLTTRERTRKRDKNPTPILRVKRNLRNRVRKMIKAVLKNPDKMYKGKNKLVSCTNNELKSHLESGFVNGMTWDNYGKLWHVDHIKPCALFDMKKESDIKTVNHFANLQPLWAIDNLKKGDKYAET